jgi:transposase-like protein
MQIQCPHCHSDKRQTKAGRTRSGSQRYHCTACAKDYTPQPKTSGYPAPVRQQAVSLSLEGLSQRKVARILGVCQQSVANWLEQAHARLEQDQVPVVPVEAAALSGSVAELDELYVFIGAKRGQKKTGAT